MGLHGWRLVLGSAALFALSCTRAPVIDDGGTAEAGVTCTEARDCDDGVFCNGLELCLPAADGTRCYPGVLPCRGACDENGAGCLGCTPADADRDDHDALACGGDDCDDADPARHPGAREVCDAENLDEDCVAGTFGILDHDGDGATSSACCNEGHCGSDCNDRSTVIAPGLSETCDEVDQDCDGRVDEDASLTCVVPTALRSVCREGSCVVERCADGRADCNGRPGDGCERDLTSDAATCSSCDVFCEGSEACIAGRCEGERCPAGQHTCPSGCAFNDDVASCGTRCEPCPTIAGATATCVSGACTYWCLSGAAPTPDDAGILWCPPTSVAVTTILDTATDHLTLSTVDVDVTSSELTLTVHISPSTDGEIHIGREVRASGEPFAPRSLVPGANPITIEIWFRGRPFFTTHLRVNLLGSAPSSTSVLREGDGWDQFGYAVAIDGGRLVVGAPREDSGASTVDGDRSDESVTDAGAAYVFERLAGVWTLVAYLKPHDPETYANFGGTVAIDGERVVVGARYATGTLGEFQSGAAYVFERVGGAWTETTRLVPPEPDASDAFGASVAIDGDTIAVGAPYEDGSGSGFSGDPADDSYRETGAVYTFEHTATGWSFRDYIKRPSRGRNFGLEVRLGGTTLAALDRDQVEVYDRLTRTSQGAFTSGERIDLDPGGTTLLSGTSETRAAREVRERVEGVWSLVASVSTFGGAATDGTTMAIRGRDLTLWRREASGWTMSATLVPPPTETPGVVLDLADGVLAAGSPDANSVLVFMLEGS